MRQGDKETGRRTSEPNTEHRAPNTEHRIREITARLEAVYGHAEWKPGAHGLDPVEVLVATILSQHTADVNSERAFETLRARYPDWRAVIDAPRAELAETIFVAGMRNQKAKRIQEVLHLIEEREGRLSLDRVAAMSDDDACAYLMSLPGIGPKTAAILLCFSMGRPVIPVDTHVFRVAWRLGLIRRQIGEAKAHAVLQALVPRDIVYQFHVALIRHGRAVCKAPRPRCAECVLTDLCAYYREVVGPARRVEC